MLLKEPYKKVNDGMMQPERGSLFAQSRNKIEDMLEIAGYDIDEKEI